MPLAAVRGLRGRRGGNLGLGEIAGGGDFLLWRDGRRFGNRRGRNVERLSGFRGWGCNSGRQRRPLLPQLQQRAQRRQELQPEERPAA